VMSSDSVDSHRPRDINLGSLLEATHLAHACSFFARNTM